MNTYIVGMSISPPRLKIDDQRCEEMAFATARQALDQAGIHRRDLNAVTLATSDEMDGRAISSMLMAGPAGAYLKDELRVTDSGLTGLAMAAMRCASGRFPLGLLVSWSQTSQIDIDDLTRMRAEPFTLRQIGLNQPISDGLQAGAMGKALGLTEAQVAERVAQRMQQGSRNPRSAGSQPLTADAIASSPFVAWPLREKHAAPASDGCVAMVLASGQWLESHPGTKPLARLKAVSSGIDRYALGQERLSNPDLFERTLADLLVRCGRNAEADIDVIEFEAQNGWQDLALEKCASRHRRIGAVNPSGGAWAQNPLFCTGLVNAAEAVLQVSGNAGAHQVRGARFAVAHGSHGFAQQGHTFAAFERIEA
ncbi:thiolase C-terminal domain-containing protein [Hydrogenophaga sp.]|jgi:acetyl-CoA acetyltransferase|uniref:thiolase C-terminal domain-containing protein n=1 Tax=Hydrogenophaga sp. TaxID=1904254 RepID=UPI003F703B33